MKLTTEQAREILANYKSSYTGEELTTAMKMGADALEKQIPKKPRKNTFGSYCPICNHYFDPRAWKSAYCGQCGNKLDWTEESDN